MYYKKKSQLHPPLSCLTPSLPPPPGLHLPHISVSVTGSDFSLWPDFSAPDAQTDSQMAAQTY